MRNSLKSEFLKLATVRSTYVLALIAAIITTFFALYVEGYKGEGEMATSALSKDAFTELIPNVGNITASFAAVVLILFFVHEYRYNTIMHTLTATNSRTKALAAKLLAAAAYSAVFALLMIGVGLLMYLLGVSLRGGTLAPQVFSPLATIGKSVFYTVGYSLLGALFAVLTRNLAAAIVLLLFGLGTVEALLGLLLKHNNIYLPLTTLHQVLGSARIEDGAMTPLRAAALFAVYLIVGWAIGWYLFLKRDAN
ncbi:ABC transporter permease [Candidatus Saccharibacteria bacterium]|nr:ABC transporter permease [Candidatus Saccharibacteria bacterium]